MIGINTSSTVSAFQLSKATVLSSLTIFSSVASAIGDGSYFRPYEIQGQLS